MKKVKKAIKLKVFFTKKTQRAQFKKHLVSAIAEVNKDCITSVNHSNNFCIIYDD